MRPDVIPSSKKVGNGADCEARSGLSPVSAHDCQIQERSFMGESSTTPPF